VAEERQLMPTHVPLLVQAYNVGRCTWQREHGGSSVLDKTAEFPIARVEDVMSRLFPVQPATPAEKVAATAVSAEYYRSPSWAARRQQQAIREKMASALLPPLPGTKLLEPIPGDPKIKMAKAFGQAQRVKQAIEAARHQVGVAKDALLTAFSELRGYFKQANYLRRPFAEIEFNAPRLFGPAATHALEYVYTQNRMREPRAMGLPKQATAADPRQAPYSLVSQVIQRGEALVEAQTHYAELARTGQEKVAGLLRPFAGAPGDTTDRSRSALGAMLRGSSEKQALGSVVGGAIGNLAGSGIQTLLTSKPTSELVGNVAEDLDDPVHTDELRQIQARAMLSDFMANDEVLSGYSPEEVTNAYNEISSLSPRAATQSAIMRPLLRKRLTAGSVEPFEAQQMADIEKTIRQTETPMTAEKTSGALRHATVLD
jgi:hypothetical protein